MEAKKLKGKSRRIPETSQIELFDDVSFEGASFEKGADEEAFVNPSPEGIFIGNCRLRGYLIDREMGWVIRLRELLESSDLSGFKSRYQGTGRRALHPVIMIGLIVYGVMEGKWSLRDLERLAFKDVGAWWVCGGEQPDHSTIGKFINRFSDILTEDYFVELTRMLVKNFRIGSGDVAGDGTVIEAAASRYKAIKAEAAKAAADEARCRAEFYPSDEGAKLAAEKAQVVLDVVVERDRKAGRKKGKGSKGSRVCPLEPECVIQPLKNGSVRPSYKPSILANSDRLIVGKSIDASDETSALSPMFEEYLSIFSSEPSRLLLDAGYHNNRALGFCLSLELDVLCPSGQADSGKWEKRARRDKFGKERFRYDEERDVYICPAGSELLSYKKERRNGQICVSYRCLSCGGCKLREGCTEGKSGRTIKRYEVDELKEAMALVFENERARKAYSRRKGMVEPVFSELRGVQGLNRFRRLGLKGVALEFSLHCIAYNLKRAIRHEGSVGIEAGGVLFAVFAREDGQIRLVGFVGMILIGFEEWY